MREICFALLRENGSAWRHRPFPKTMFLGKFLGTKNGIKPSFSATLPRKCTFGGCGNFQSKMAFWGFSQK